MAETLNSLSELAGKAVGSDDANVAPIHVQKLDKEGRAYATGKRKNAIARVWIMRSTGRAK